MLLMEMRKLSFTLITRNQDGGLLNSKATSTLKKLPLRTDQMDGDTDSEMPKLRLMANCAERLLQRPSKELGTPLSVLNQSSVEVS